MGFFDNLRMVEQIRVQSQPGYRPPNQPAAPVQVQLPYAIVAVMLRPGGIKQEVVGKVPTPAHGERWIALQKASKPFLVDFYVAEDDAKLAKRLDQEARISRR